MLMKERTKIHVNNNSPKSKKLLQIASRFLSGIFRTMRTDFYHLNINGYLVKGKIQSTPKNLLYSKMKITYKYPTSSYS